MKTIVVLMSTYNGEKYLKVQIDSILAQQGVDTKLMVRDDGSTDSTIQILQEYQSKGLLSYYVGSNLGPAKSFMELLHNAPEADYYAFADQDDYWFPKKLSIAIEKLEKNCLKDNPALYHSGTTLVDEYLNIKDFTPIYPYYCTKFQHVLISFLAIGCTFVFNTPLKNIICKYNPKFQLAHDSWVEQVCRAVGGSVIYDKQSYIYYRQHSKNVSGGTSSIFKKLKKRLNNLISNRCMRSKSVVELMKGYKELMPFENRIICQKILDYKKGWKYKYALIKDKNIRTGQPKLDRSYLMAVLLGIF